MSACQAKLEKRFAVLLAARPVAVLPRGTDEPEGGRVVFVRRPWIW